MGPELDPVTADERASARAPATVATGRAVTALYGITAFVASGLIFVVEPLVARTLLPALGGSASVWNSAMLTFQVLLLGGYLFAHVAATRLPGHSSQVAAVLLVLVAAAALPVGLRDGWRPPTGDPAMWTLLAVAAAVGGPFLALACVSPTLQHWYGGLRPGVDPYVLYAAGNLGSFIGLLAYPLVIDRALGMGDQKRWWTGAYLVFAALFVACAALARRSPATTERATRGAAAAATPVEVTGRQLSRWVLMAAGPSLLLLGVTRHLSTDVAAIPLLWVVPLSLYLLTFVIAFSGRAAWMTPLAGRLGTVLAAGTIISLAAALPAAFGLVLHLLTFFVIAHATHGRLAAERPPLASLTSYYLALSMGGTMGGIVGGLVAPVAFPGILEYPLGIVACLVWVVPRAGLEARARAVAAAVLGAAIVAAAALRLITADANGPARGVQVALGVAALAALATSHRGWQYTGALAVMAAIAVALPGAATIAQERTYYGVTRVLENDEGWHLLVSGTTVHGAQDPARPEVPLVYYAPSGPIDQVIELTDTGRPRSIGVVGLGAGSMAAWLDADDEAVFYEIDPAVIDLATDAAVFSFIDDSRGTVRIVEGDGRLSLADVSAMRHDLIVIDAFSSDAIPVHLLTREALAEYRRALTPDGVIAFHISNRFFDLQPVLARLATDASLDALSRTGIGDLPGSAVTTVVALGSPAALADLAAADGWAAPEGGGAVWTDDHADVLSALSGL